MARGKRKPSSAPRPKKGRGKGARKYYTGGYQA